MKGDLAMPTRIDETLLVIEAFKDPQSGVQYLPGDHAQLRHRSIRRVASERPEFFRMEYETTEVDQELLVELERCFEDEYEQEKARLAEAERQRERALRLELNEQGRRDPLERQYAAQEAERKKRQREAKEELERQKVEERLALQGAFRSGWNVDQ
jgi:hypothetical protein